MGQPTFGGELRRLREERGLSLKGFARLVHYDPGYLSKIENGLKPPTSMLANVCDEVLDTCGHLSAMVPDSAIDRALRLIHKDLTEGRSTRYAATIDSNPLSTISDGADRAVTAETARDLQLVSAHYRRAYRAMPAAELLEASRSHLGLILALQPASQDPPVRQLLLRSVGESAVLTAALLGTDQVRYNDALPYLALAQNAARENDDADITSVVLACRAFLISFSGVAQSKRPSLPRLPLVSQLIVMRVQLPAGG